MLDKDFRVIYEDNHLLAVNKPSGLLVHEAEKGLPTLEDQVKHYIKVRYKKPGDVYLGTLHRIDRPTSGVVIFAKTSKAAARMSTLFSTGKIEKYYVAVVDKRPEHLQEKLIHYLVKNPENNTVKAYNSMQNGAKRAELDYELLGQVDNMILLGVKIHTGRPHQIRTQFKKVGMPINGDLKYGSDVVYSDQSIALHARCMRFIHPVKNEPVEIVAELPKNLVWNQFKDLLIQEGK